MPAKDQKVTFRDEIIEILRPCFKRIAFATYDRELFDKISSVTWSVIKSKTDKEYLNSSKYGSLHKLVIEHFYGEEFLKEAYTNKYVIDHLDNDGYNCTCENLAIIPRMENSAKGLTYDIERKESIRKFAINITRDFKTTEFQISLIFNKRIDIVINEEVIPLSVIYFKYGVDFKTAFIDARSIINDLNSSWSIDLSHLRFDKCFYKKAKIVYVSKEEFNSGVCIKDGKIYIVQGSHNTIMNKVKHNKEIHQNEN